MNRAYFSHLKVAGLLVPMSVLLASVSASASELTLTDCSGAITAIKQVESTTPSQITLDVSGAVGTIVLTNITTGQEMTAPIKAGAVVFDKVTAGTWKACAQSGDVMVKNVDVSSTETMNSSGPSLLGVVGGAAAIGSVVAISTSGGSDSEGTSALQGSIPAPEGLPSSPSDPATDKRPSGSNSSSKKSGGVSINSTAKKPSTNANCFVGTDVTPISPFS